MNQFKKNGIQVDFQDALDCYEDWEPPVVIISDGAFGLNSFEGDTLDPSGLQDWYKEHIDKWSEFARTDCTLWFWNTEVGWATVHPILDKKGWEYRGMNTWNKTIKHIAGNSNTKTLRRFPAVTEVCAHYVRRNTLPFEGRQVTIKEWVYKEWKRTGLPFNQANKACGVADAATRKYLTQCHLWYFTPPEMMEKMAAYANEHGKPEGRPYFSIDGKNPVKASEWEGMRAKFRLKAGVTNVWEHPPIHGTERIKVNGKALHINQKPLELIKLIIEASSDEGDVVWDPFGGLCTTAVACLDLNRKCYAAENNKKFFKACINRLEHIAFQEGLPFPESKVSGM